MSEAIDCTPTVLSNGAKLYWQFNCLNIWLTLEDKNGNKVAIDSVETMLYGYTYRLGFHLIKEYPRALLFRGGCPANGPCGYYLLDKNSGRNIREFDAVIGANTDVWGAHPYPYPFDFIVFLSEDRQLVHVYFVNTGLTRSLTMEDGLEAHQFEPLEVKNNTLFLRYYDDNNKLKTITVNLRKEGRRG